MSYESYFSQTYTRDNIMSDSYHADDEAHTNGTTIRRPSFVFAPQAPAPLPRYAPVTRRHKGILHPSNAAEDAAFFAQANRKYNERIQEILREEKMKAKEDKSEAAEKGNEMMTAKTNMASNSSEDLNTPDILGEN